jgi:NAD(P)H dehydrogenase (quinone)
MEYIEWNSSFSLGIPTMDREHEILIGLINQLYRNVDLEKDKQKIQAIIVGLIDYTQYHFADEEEILLAARYPAYDKQRQAHQEFTRRMIQYREMYFSKQTDLISEILTYLKVWWTSHIQIQDMAYAEYIKAHQSGMILIVGASGKTGRAVLKALAKRGAPVRALVHRLEQINEFKALGAAEVVCGDFRDDAFLTQAAQGVQKVYHICPNVQPDEFEIGTAAIRAAQLAGVDQFVFHSVLHPQVEEMPHHWKKLRVEEALFKSGVGYTILQPAAYMQNVLAQWDAVLNQGHYAVPYAAATRLGMVDLSDVAEAAAIVLTRPGHTGAVYELAGSQALTQTEIADAFARALHRTVDTQAVPLDLWEQRARAGGMPDYAVDTLLRMFTYYERYGFWGSPTVLTALLGRAPITFEEFITRTLRERTADQSAV